MNDLALLEQAYLSFKRHDFESALRHYRSLAEAGRCNQKTLEFFIRLCEEQLNQVDHVRGSPSLQVVSSGSEYRLKEVERIRASAIFDERFYSNLYGHKISSGMSALEDFCSRGWRARRDPNPFFSVARYLQKEESVDLSGNLVNPLINYLDSQYDLKKAKHAGIFDYFEYINHPLTSLCFPCKTDDPESLGHPLKILVVIHAYYPESLATIFPSLRHMPCRFDLVVTVCSCGDKEVVKEYLEKVDLPIDVLDIKVLTNLGRDLLPFVQVIKGLRLQNKAYDFVLKLHTKRSVASGKGKEFGGKWLEGSLSNLLGSPENVKYILLELLQTTNCALVSPLISLDVFRFCKWKNNLAPISHLLDRFGVRESPEDFICFPAGSMFWVDFKAAVLIASCFEESRVPPEPLPSNGSYLHAFERLVPYILESTQKRMQSHCNLDLDQLSPINFSSLISFEKFEEWMTSSIHRLVQLMATGGFTRKLRFTAYKNSSISCVVVGGDLEKIMATLISLYFSRSLIDCHIVVYSSSLTSWEIEDLMHLFPGISCQKEISSADPGGCFLGFLSQLMSGGAMILQAGKIVNPVQFGHMLARFFEDKSRLCSLQSDDRKRANSGFPILLGRSRLFIELLQKFSLEGAQDSDLISLLRQCSYHAQQVRSDVF